MTDTVEVPEITYHLYNFPRSSCARRIRIALSLKSLGNVLLHNVDMDAKDHQTDAYRVINASGGIPTLVVEKQFPSGLVNKFSLSQSTAILEYLEEIFPYLYPLLPPPEQTEKRARVREMVAVITQDIFPLANRKVADRVGAIRDFDEDKNAFVTTALNEGFDAYEALLQSHGGEYSVGNQVTLADVCLVPQVLQATSYGIDVLSQGRRWPLIKAVVERLTVIEAFGREVRLNVAHTTYSSQHIALRHHAQIWG